MADDLGDSHPSSLQQGGELPANSTALRTVGKICPLNGTTITVNLFPEKPTNNVILRLFNQSGVETTNVSGPGTLTLTYTAAAIEYHTLRVQNANNSNSDQKVYVKANYTAPQNLRSPPVIVQPMFTTNTGFRFNITQPQGLNYVVEGSTNLASWIALRTNTAPFSFVDSEATALPARFYRARYAP